MTATAATVKAATTMAGRIGETIFGAAALSAASFSCELPVQITPFPEKPVLQMQEYDPGVFVQVALAEQSFRVELRHSLMSKQVTPFPEKPASQAHE